MSLLECKTPGEVVAEIRMTRLARDNPFLIVEGPADLRFWRVWRDERCEVVIAGGRPGVETVVKKSDEHDWKGVIGVLDDDWDTAEGRVLPSSNLVATDAHDLEAMLLRAGGLRRLLYEHGDERRVKRLEDGEGRGVDQALLARGEVFGRLRWANQRRSPDLRIPVSQQVLKSLHPFVPLQSWEVDEPRLLDFAARHCSSGSREALQSEIAALPPADPWTVCNGHDLVSLLALGLRCALGDHPASRMTDARLHCDLRLAADGRDLEQTGLWRDIRAWELRSPPYRVLKAS